MLTKTSSRIVTIALATQSSQMADWSDGRNAVNITNSPIRMILFLRQNYASSLFKSCRPSQNLGWMKCCFTCTETVGLLGTGAQDGHLDFHTAPELCLKTCRPLTFHTEHAVTYLTVNTLAINALLVRTPLRALCYRDILTTV